MNHPDMDLKRPNKLLKRPGMSDIFLAIISFILVMAVLTVGQGVFMPVIISLFLSFVLLPVIRWLHKRGIPPALASFLSLGLVFLILGMMGMLLSVSYKSLSDRLPFYVERFRVLTLQLVQWLDSLGVTVDREVMLEAVNTQFVAGLVGKSFQSIMVVFKYGLVIFFLTLFTLLEAGRFKDKVVKNYGKKNFFQKYFRVIGLEIQTYMFVKTLISLATGVLVWAFLKIIGIDFPLIWGFLTFLLNFIPTIGSIVAAVPPLLLTLIQMENPLKYAVIVLIGLLAIQILFGNYLDPKLMGQNLNISVLVIFIALLVWGWMWGPIGMLLAVPLTVCAKVALVNLPWTRRFGKMLEK
jgi:predicted PurR-regulated permease PerM